PNVHGIEVAPEPVDAWKFPLDRDVTEYERGITIGTDFVDGSFMVTVFDAWCLELSEVVGPRSMREGIILSQDLVQEVDILPDHGLVPSSSKGPYLLRGGGRRGGLIGLHPVCLRSRCGKIEQHQDK